MMQPSRQQGPMGMYPPVLESEPMQSQYFFPWPPSSGGGMDRRIERLEREMQRLERQIERLDRRVTKLERRWGVNNRPEQPNYAEPPHYPYYSY